MVGKIRLCQAILLSLGSDGIIIILVTGISKLPKLAY